MKGEIELKLFSIVIPVYNVEDYLSKCVDSIINQIVQNQIDCEILLIDDGSTDNSGAICDQYYEKYENYISVYHNENQGLLLTRRFGYKKAKGEYILNCDSDDLLDENMLNRLKNVIEKFSFPDLIFFNYYSFDGENKEIVTHDIFSNDKECVVTKENVYDKYFKSQDIVSMCCKIYKKKCIDLTNDYKKFGKFGTGEDTLQTIELINNARTFVYLNEPLYLYRMGTGMTRRFDENYYFSFKKVFDEIVRQKNVWNIDNFNTLFAIKVLQTSARTTTQSRYKKWNSFSEQKTFLSKINSDCYFIESIKYLDEIKPYLKKNYIVLLKLLKENKLNRICFMLRIRNLIG